MKRTRRSRKHSRSKASAQTGVPEATIRRFEDTGEISLRQFLVLWNHYCDLKDLNQLAREDLRSLDEIDL
ncbi:MAG: transcriptional regulator [Gammaproteobacteria bacterium]|nr:transcriptional regulator [Gammaproteobacteria bacterium]